MDAAPRTFPLGPLQQPMWRFWSAHRESSAYVMPEAYFFGGDLDLEAATYALDETVRRHESLRTTFRDLQREVVQVVSPVPSSSPIEVLDLRDVPAAELADQLEVVLDAVANTGFDLTAGPVIRLTALRLPEHRTALVMAVHQIVCDGASIAIVLDEFGSLYRSVRQRTSPGLTPAPPGYGAFVAEQLADLADAGFGEDLAYWAERLAGASGSVLPGDGGEEPAAATSLDTYAEFTTLELGLSDRTWSFARQAGSTPFSVLFTTMLVMVVAAADRTTGDVCIGTTTSSRTPRFGGTVGMLSNVVVPRSLIDLSTSFAEALGEVSLQLLDAIDFQHVPFGHVVDAVTSDAAELAPELVRTMFSAGAVGALTLGESDLSERLIRTSQGPFDTTVVCEITPSGIALDWQFALRAYSRELAHGYCAAYPDLLAALLANPDTAMDSLDLTDILPRTTGRGARPHEEVSH
ncbi:MAG: condensation domain-containing protein [Nocardioides sp.]|uniref:condensation domain-containing protein n=1 Tax=Nocardioides sp. TaxID=35761 RepID=UPI0023909702|nr:condensation domain-containing protein [Nocardioides sp.]MDE0775689.1 condensation domain-containing protein [Nocardioides sp.]